MINFYSMSVSLFGWSKSITLRKRTRTLTHSSCSISYFSLPRSCSSFEYDGYDGIDLWAAHSQLFSKVSHWNSIRCYSIQYTDQIGRLIRIFDALCRNNVRRMDDWRAFEIGRRQFLRVMREGETIRDKMRANGVRPYEDIRTTRNDDDDPFNCTTN